jgi:hypothetical protein
MSRAAPSCVACVTRRARLALALPLALSTLLGCARSEPSPSPSASVPSFPEVSAPSAAPVEAPAPSPAERLALLAGPCEERDDAFVFVAPRAPFVGATLRLRALSETDGGGELMLRGPDGALVASSSASLGGPPYVVSLDLSPTQAGTYRAALVRRGAQGLAMVACHDVLVAAQPTPVGGSWSAVWPVTAAWDRRSEAVYSAWVQELFDAPLSERFSYPALHHLLYDPARNFLHGHAGAEPTPETPGAPVIDPDCADFPYFLRAYFARALGLPFAYSSCTRGSSGAPPTCTKRGSPLGTRPTSGPGTFASLAPFLRVTLADAVHSGNGRLPAERDLGDYYAIRLSRETLRPGVVYADPYGHLLVVVRRLAETAERGGVLLAVDGQPDGTIGRKRFYRGNFLFELDPALGSAGFKRFRPVVLAGAETRTLGNAAIAASPAYGDFGLEQYASGKEGFYDLVEDVLTAAPAPPARALAELVDALEEQVRARVISVDNAEVWKQKDARSIDMPKGAAIFETVGPWEDFSTPSRDLRLLIALDVVRDFPARVVRRASRYVLPEGASPDVVRKELEAELGRVLASRSFAYRRSDGMEQTLTLAELLTRAEALEMAYNPNDCVEVRWGAPEGSEEAAACKRRASPGQRVRMARQRAWFHERKRPPRE